MSNSHRDKHLAEEHDRFMEEVEASGIPPSMLIMYGPIIGTVLDPGDKDSKGPEQEPEKDLPF